MTLLARTLAEQIDTPKPNVRAKVLFEKGISKIFLVDVASTSRRSWVDKKSFE